METDTARELFRGYLYRRYGYRSTPKHYLSDLTIFLAYLGEKSVTAEGVRKLLGHSSLQMSQHYACLYDSMVKDQFESAVVELEGVVVRDWPMPTATPVPVQADFQQVA